VSLREEKAGAPAAGLFLSFDFGKSEEWDDGDEWR